MKTFLLLLWLSGITSLLYSQNKQSILTVNQMHSDLAILKQSFTGLHPGVFRYLSPKELDHHFAVFAKQTNRPLTLGSYYLKLSQLVTKLKCGHTYLNPYNQKKAVSSPLFSSQVMPFLFKIIKRKIVLTHNLSEHTAITQGDELVSINGISTKDIIDSLLTVSRTDGQNGLSRRLDNIGISPYLVKEEAYTLFDIYFPLFFDARNSVAYNIVVKSFSSGKTVAYKINLISKTQRQQQYQERFTREFLEPTGSFEWIASNHAYLKIRDFTTKGWGKNYRVFLDSVFRELKSRKTPQLIVDIRGNEGGDDEVRNKVISYLIDHPAYSAIRRYYRFLELPSNLSPYLQTWDASFKKPKLAKDYIKTSENLYYRRDIRSIDSILPDQNHFSGRVYLLINSTNSSSSFFMADILQQNGFAKLIGEPTGGTKQGINGGQLFFLYLPNSGIEVDIPLIYQSPLIKRKDEGVHPDRKVITRALNVFRGEDKQLIYLLRKNH